ncbi:MAG: sulfotransferase, partial [Actinomycetota bacterium]|nr:sulfotransferase [Actinomycetota bacterium]
MRARQHRVVILSEPVPPSPYPPVFLIGCPRSGTSLVRRVVDSHSRFACPPESHFLLSLLSTLSTRRSMVGMESMGFGRSVVVARLRSFAEQFFLEYAAACGKPRWADKTPFYVDVLDGLDELFAATPRYVMIYRHGLDVTYSMMEVLPELFTTVSTPEGSADHRDVRAAAAYWADKVSRMLDFERRHPDRVLRVRYEDLTTA